MSTIRCLCGKACIELASRPRTSVECCCCDCRGATIWCREQAQLVGDHHGHHDEYNHNNEEVKPSVDVYIDNDIVNIEGEEYLQLMKLRKTSPMVRVMTKCCHSLLLNVHWIYFKQCILILPAACRLEYSGEPVLPYCRIQTKFWDTEQWGELPLLTREPGANVSETTAMVCPQYRCGSPLWPFYSGLFQKAVLGKGGECPPRPKKRRGETSQALIQRLEAREPIIVAGVEEPPLEGHCQTGGGIFSLTIRNPFFTNPPDNDDQCACCF